MERAFWSLYSTEEWQNRYLFMSLFYGLGPCFSGKAVELKCAKRSSNASWWKSPHPRARDAGIELSSCPECLVQTEQANLLQHCIGWRLLSLLYTCFLLERLPCSPMLSLSSSCWATPIPPDEPALGRNWALIPTLGPACWTSQRASYHPFWNQKLCVSW